MQGKRQWPLLSPSTPSSTHFILIPGDMKHLPLYPLIFLPFLPWTSSMRPEETPSMHASSSVDGWRSVSANLDGALTTLSWQTDFPSQTVSFRLSSNGELSTSEWWMVGFSDHGEFNGSDYCQLDVESGTLWDGFINSRFGMGRDRQQDCQLQDVSSSSFTFRRKFSTCDPKDYAMEIGTVQFILARSSARTNNFSSPSISSQLVFGLVVDNEDNDKKPEEPGQFTFSVKAQAAHVPAQVTTYWCIVKRLPREVLKRKHHVTWLWSSISPGSEGLVHHLMLFHCPTGNQEEYEGDCNSPSKPRAAAACSKVIGAISMGEEPIVYPSDAGLPFGGPDFNPFVMVEIHYNNVPRTAGLVDSSGFDLVLTPRLRPHDAGIIEIGVIYGDANSIPPHQKDFPITGYCTADCTKKFPEDGINIFYSQMHGHLVMRKLWNSLYRNGVKIMEFNRDNHYSPHWQHILRLDPTVHVQRGDVMATTCVFDTTKHRDVVLGGYGIEDEMCISYNYYWPASEIEMCKSAVSNETLHRFFRQREVGGEGMTIADKYKAVEWDEEAVRDLSEMFSTAPLNQHCLRFDGSTFPGHPSNWSTIDHPHLTYGAYDKGRAAYECPSLND